MMMPQKKAPMSDPKEQALRDILKLIVDTGLMDSLEMPSESTPDEMMKEAISEAESMDDMSEDYEDDEEDMKEPVSLSITQLGAMKKPIPKMDLEEQIKPSPKPAFRKKGKR